jgi:hypothetical protein
VVFFYRVDGMFANFFYPTKKLDWALYWGARGPNEGERLIYGKKCLLGILDNFKIPPVEFL